MACCRGPWRRWPGLGPRGAGRRHPQPLTATPGDAARGRAIVASRQQGLCLLCHRGPFPEERFQGTVATSLAGAGSRWTAAQLRLRIVDSRRLNPDSVMPAFHRTTACSAWARPGRASRCWTRSRSRTWWPSWPR
jgi:hypothetical protein